MQLIQDSTPEILLICCCSALDHDVVDVRHVMVVAPYVLSHMIEFYDDYKAKFQSSQDLGRRKQEADLTRMPLHEIKGNFDEKSHIIKLVDSQFSGKQISTKNSEELRKFKDGPKPDYPLLRNYWMELKEQKDKQFTNR